MKTITVKITKTILDHFERKEGAGVYGRLELGQNVLNIDEAIELRNEIDFVETCWEWEPEEIGTRSALRALKAQLVKQNVPMTEIV